MNEVIFQNIDHDIVAQSGQTLSIAYGEDPSLYRILFLTASFFVFILAGNFLRSFLQKHNIFSAKGQSPISYIFVFLILLGSFIFMEQKIISQRINIPIEQRRNLITIELPSKLVTIKEKNKIVDTFTFSNNDYFYLATHKSNKSRSYSISLIHNGKQYYDIISSNQEDEITKVQVKLLSLGFFVKVLP